MKCNSKCSGTRKLAHWLVKIGALNWGLVGIGGLFGLGNWNVVNLLLGSVSWLENLVYLLVGISAVVVCTKCHGKCNKGATAPMVNQGGGMNNQSM
ncbi:DUF378 domain-containing protein [Patescibacteria group bacterium]|nr:DUF378 domain-containing protein [Patescibacteria group bacterium]